MAGGSVSLDHMKELTKKKDAIESEIKALMEVLESQKGIGMTSPVVDEEGYPRSDIDVYTVRHARHKVICKYILYITDQVKISLQNDHKEIMKEVEEELYRIHAEAREKNLNKDKIDSAENNENNTQQTQLSPFATINRVDSNSPAATSGLEVGDQVLKFGSVMSHNFQGLQNIASIVQHSKGKPLTVLVIRNEKEVRLTLTPQAWSGPGLLGCNIVPLKK